jgi:hypothetical protein
MLETLALAVFLVVTITLPICATIYWSTDKLVDHLHLITDNLLAGMEELKNSYFDRIAVVPTQREEEIIDRVMDEDSFRQWQDDEKQQAIFQAAELPIKEGHTDDF